MMSVRRHPTDTTFGRYLAGTADDDERREFEQHLAVCDECLDLAQFETSLLKELS